MEATLLWKHFGLPFTSSDIILAYPTLKGLECGALVLDSACTTDGSYFFDAVSTATQAGHLNASYKEGLGWFNESNIFVPPPGFSDVVLQPLETATPGVQMIKLTSSHNLLGAPWNIFVEYRQALGFDEHFSGLFPAHTMGC